MAFQVTTLVEDICCVLTRFELYSASSLLDERFLSPLLEPLIIFDYSTCLQSNSFVMDTVRSRHVWIPFISTGTVGTNKATNIAALSS